MESRQDTLAGLWVDPAHMLRALADLIETADTPPRERVAAATVARTASALGGWSTQIPADGIGTEAEQAGFARHGRALAAASEAGGRRAATRLPPPPADSLEASLARTLGAEGRIADLTTIEGGYSKQTSLFDWIGADGTRASYAMRRDAELQHIGTSVVDEYEAVAALFAAGLPVPRPVALARGCEGIAQPFMITERVAGRSIGGPLGAGQTALDPVPALAAFLARLHAIDPASLNVPRFATPFDIHALEAQIGYWTDRYHAHRQVPSPILDRALQWLRDRRETGVQPGAVVHGDCGIYNMLFDGDRFTAMLDWELVHVGSPVWDLAYVRDAVEEFGPFDRFVDLYVQAGGRRPSAAALGYYNVFRTVRSAIMCVVGAALFNRGEPVSFDLLHVNLMLYPRLVAALPGAMAEADAAS